MAVVKTMDAWCPLTPSFKPDQAARAREAGRQVWWFICCGPHHPHANMFVEYPAIEGRLLMGAMTAKQRPDGFLPGWKSFHESPGTRTAEVWQLQPDGVLICKGKPRGYLYTEQNYQDFTLQFEWRYPPGATNSNGGAQVRMTGDHGIWPRCPEFQLNQNQAGDFWAIRGFEFTGPAEQLRVMTNASFVIPGLATPPAGSVVDVSWLNERPAGSHGFVRRCGKSPFGISSRI